MDRLKVPFDAEEAWWHHTYRAVKRGTDPDDGILDIATPVVIAELRRLLDLASYMPDGALPQNWLRDRIVELEAGR